MYTIAISQALPQHFGVMHRSKDQCGKSAQARRKDRKQPALLSDKIVPMASGVYKNRRLAYGISCFEPAGL
jgi:hypothetical protein